jgi:Domain of unknown function (DUF4258)
VSRTLDLVQALAQRGEVRVSLHGYKELAADDISPDDAISGVQAALGIEDYPNYAKGPCVLVLEHDSEGKPIHVVWGIPAGKHTPAVLITSYRPDPTKWGKTWQTRRK